MRSVAEWGEYRGNPKGQELVRAGARRCDENHGVLGADPLAAPRSSAASL